VTKYSDGLNKQQQRQNNRAQYRRQPIMVPALDNVREEVPVRHNNNNDYLNAEADYATSCRQGSIKHNATGR